MATMLTPRTVTEFYHQEVLPALFARLDEAFPEFHWRRTGAGWTADNRHNFARAGGRPHEQVECFDAEGFSVGGRPLMSWLAYVNGGQLPHGGEFVAAVKHLAELVGIDAGDIDRPAAVSTPSNGHLEDSRRAAVLEAFLRVTRESLYADEAARDAAVYLEHLTGLDRESLRRLPLGFHSPQVDVVARLQAAGFNEEEIRAAGLISRHTAGDCIVGPARAANGSIMTFFAHPIATSVEGRHRYLNLAGGPRPVVFHLDEALAHAAGGREELIVVQGLIESLSIGARGLRNVGAVAGPAELMTAERWQGLARHEIRRVTLAFDVHGDDFDALDGALEGYVNANTTPDAWVLPSSLLGEYSSWHELVCHGGIERFRALVSRRIHLLRYQAECLLQKHRPADRWDDRAQRALLIEALEFDAVACTQRAAELDEHFWPVLIDEVPLLARLLVLRRHRTVHAVQKSVDLSDYESAAVRVAERTPIRTEGSVPPPSRPMTSLRVLADEVDEHAASLSRDHGRPLVGLAQHTLGGLERSIQGLRGLTVLAGGPEVDKLSLALQLGVDVVSQNSDAVLVVVSCDKTRHELMTRIKCRLSGLDWKTIVLGSGAGTHGYASHHRQAIEQAEQQMRAIGQRIVILDRLCRGTPGLEEVRGTVDELKTRSGATRALLIVDDLDTWSLPVEPQPGDEVELDRRRIEQLRELRDQDHGHIVLALCDADAETGVASRRARYAADVTLLLQRLSPAEVRQVFQRQLYPSVVEARWLARLHEQGIEIDKISVVKGDEERHQQEIELAYHHRQFSFSEEIPDWRPLGL